MDTSAVCASLRSLLRRLQQEFVGNELGENTFDYANLKEE
jgi:hypothetical protein